MFYFFFVALKSRHCAVCVENMIMILICRISDSSSTSLVSVNHISIISVNAVSVFVGL